MIQNDTEFEASLDALTTMYKSLAALQRDRVRFNYSDAWFNVMAEGPLEMIARIEVELRDYIGGNAALSTRAPLAPPVTNAP